MIRTLIYDGALCVIVGACIVAILHPRIHTGIVGGSALSALALFTVPAIEYEVSNWRLGQVTAAAVLALWLGCRFWVRRTRVKRRLRTVICERCPLHEER